VKFTNTEQKARESIHARGRARGMPTPSIDHTTASAAMLSQRDATAGAAMPKWHRRQ
jgi:hypothetical protein